MSSAASLQSESITVETLTLSGGQDQAAAAKVTAETTVGEQVEVDQVKGEQEEEDDGNGEEEEEEEGECGFCLFMKGGGCREAFINWENCIEESEKKKEDIVDKCFQVTSALKKCMEANENYYAPILRAEKRAEEELVEENQKAKEEEIADSVKKSDPAQIADSDKKSDPALI